MRDRDNGPALVTRLADLADAIRQHRDRLRDDDQHDQADEWAQVLHELRRAEECCPDYDGRGL